MPLRVKKCILVVQKLQQKALCKSVLGHLWSSTWYFLMMHECNFHVQAKNGFQWMHGVNFPKDGHNMCRFYLTRPGKLNGMATDDINPPYT